MRRYQDHYAKKAKSGGYPARSVYKLEEIQKRFSILKPGMKVLDLGASPGSWSIYAAKIVGPKGSIVAVDIQDRIAPVSGTSFFFIHGDMHDSGIIQEISRHGPYDCIMSDAAPSTTGNRTVDTARSEALVESAIAYCDKLLVTRGSLVVKLFQGGAQQQVFAEIQRRFETAKRFKPTSSRKESFEVFCVGIGYKIGEKA